MGQIVSTRALIQYEVLIFRGAVTNGGDTTPTQRGRVGGLRFWPVWVTAIRVCTVRTIDLLTLRRATYAIVILSNLRVPGVWSGLLHPDRAARYTRARHSYFIPCSVHGIYPQYAQLPEARFAVARLRPALGHSADGFKVLRCTGLRKHYRDMLHNTKQHWLSV